MSTASRLLLDTHALIWWLTGNERLPLAIRAVIGSDRTTVSVSAASAWEIATKWRIGKLPEADPFADRIPAVLREQGFQPIPVSVADGQRAGLLVGEHGDPFDRMLAAQALARDLTLATNDTVFAGFGVRTLWD
jgi:PIN domain nuclease of toxin-antitoxin system